MPDRVTFYSDGIELVGYLYLPADLESGEKRPAVLLCHGFGADQRRFLPEIAGHLSGQGFPVMTFDYRGFGESAGPKWRMIPLEQISDIRNALTFFQSREGVDPARIGLYGTSFGGGNVCYAAALDRRVKAVVSVIGMGCGERWLRTLRRPWEWQEFQKEMEEDWRQRVVSGQSRVVDRGHIMLSDPETEAKSAWMAQQFPDACSHMPMETAQAVADYHPEDVVHRIAPRPVMFIVAEKDVLVPNEITRELYDRAGEPKRWVVLPGCAHYDAYFPPGFYTVMAETTEWFKKYL